MALLVAGILVIAFVANVAIGSINGNPIVGNVPEMLMLLGASIFFVIAILKREADRDKTNQNND